MNGIFVQKVNFGGTEFHRWSFKRKMYYYFAANMHSENERWDYKFFAMKLKWIYINIHHWIDWIISECWNNSAQLLCQFLHAFECLFGLVLSLLALLSQTQDIESCKSVIDICPAPIFLSLSLLPDSWKLLRQIARAWKSLPLGAALSII